TTAASAHTGPTPATLSQSAVLLSARSASGLIAMLRPHGRNAMTSPMSSAIRATTDVLASSAAVRLGTAWNVVRMVPKRYSVVTASVASTMITAMPKL